MGPQNSPVGKELSSGEEVRGIQQERARELSELGRVPIIGDFNFPGHVFTPS